MTSPTLNIEDPNSSPDALEFLQVPTGHLDNAIPTGSKQAVVVFVTEFRILTKFLPSGSFVAT
jgi:hypothetical protein